MNSFCLKLLPTLSLLFSLIVFAETPKRIEVQGHRGARGSYPENTLKAFQFALDVGVDVLELDLQVTKDNQVIVAHDQVVDTKLCVVPRRLLSTVEFKNKKEVPFRTLTLDQVKLLDCGSRKNPRFPQQKLVKGEKIPTLDEVYGLVKSSPLKVASTVGFNIELKSVPALADYAPAPADFAKLVLDVVKKHEMSKRTVIQSFDHRTLVAVKRLDSSIQTAALMSDNHVHYTAALKAIDANILSPNIGWITQEDVERSHKAGIKVIPWTANEKEHWEYLVSLGVDGIITDYPKELIHWLSTKGLR